MTSGAQIRLDPQALRETYDAQLRARVPDPAPAGVTIDADGPVLRFVGLDHGGFVTYRSLDGLDGPELDALIGRQRDFFAARGESVEWKLHGHDRPEDLPARLRAAGFVPQERETVVVGLVAPLAAVVPALPPGVRLREVTERDDLERIAQMESRVWNEPRGYLAEGLGREVAADPGGITIVVAETEERPEVVSAGWVRYESGTAFASLWGGSTLPQWRRRGIYHALVTYRARLAAARDFHYLQVDASDDSRPILEKLGFVAITDTTPYVFTP